MRAALYRKALRLGTAYGRLLTPGESAQLATEGIEDLDSYFSSFVPSFFFGMLAPFAMAAVLFAIAFAIPGANPLAWVVALVLLALVPAIPLAIVAISRFAKRGFYR